MAVIDQKVIDTLKDNGKNFCFRKAVTTLKVPTYNNYELDHIFCDHKANAWVKRPDIVSCFPVKTDAADIYGAQWAKHGNVTFMTDPKKNPWEIGRQFYRCTNTDTVNSWMDILTNLGPNCSFECWFRIKSGTNLNNVIVGSSDLNSAVNLNNGKYILIINGQVKTAVNDAKVRDIQITPDAWHHFFYCVVGTKLLIALDGKWLKDVISTKNADTTFFNIGGWNSPNFEPKGSIVDFAAICLRKTARPLPKDTTSAGFRLVECWREYSVRNGMIGEPRWSYLRQDIQNSRFYAKVASGTYGVDPLVNPMEYEKDSQLMCITDVGGRFADNTGKTQWTATNVYPCNQYYQAPYSFFTGGKFGKFIKSGGQDIVIGKSDFTFSVDFYIYGPNNYAQKKYDWENYHGIMSGETNALLVELYTNIEAIGFGLCGNSAGWHMFANNMMKFNTWYRLIIQRRKGIANAWLNGIHVLVNAVDTKNYSGKVTWIGGYEDTERLNLRGAINNITIWNKALFLTGQIVYDANRKNSVMKKIEYMEDTLCAEGIDVGVDGFYTLS